MADPARVAAARLLLDQLGLTVADLQGADLDRPTAPSVAAYLPQVQPAAGPGARKTYGSYWAQMAAAWGDRPLTEIKASDIEALQREMIATARPRRNSRGGRHAGEHLIAAARAFYNRAIADGLVARGESPAHQVCKSVLGHCWWWFSTAGRSPQHTCLAVHRSQTERVAFRHFVLPGAGFAPRGVAGPAARRPRCRL